MQFAYVHSQQKEGQVSVRWITRAQHITKPERWLVQPWVRHYKKDKSYKHYSCNAHPTTPCFIGEISDHVTQIWQSTIDEIHASGAVEQDDYFDFGYIATLKRACKKPPKAKRQTNPQAYLAATSYQQQ